MAVLGLDIGTTGCKVVAVSWTGTIVGRGHREYSLRSPREGWAELDADEVWSAVSFACRDATRGTKEPVSAVSIAAAAEVAVPVAASGKVLGPAIVSIDQRTVDEYHSVLEKVGAARLTELGGFEPRPHHTLFRWLWIRDHEPSVYEQALWLLGWMEFVCLRLDLAPCVDRSLAVRSAAFDLQRNSWDDGLLDELGLSRDRLPRVVASGEVIGRAQGRGCEQLGIAEGTLVVAGGVDQLCADFGIGPLQDGEAMLSIGTVVVLTVDVATEANDLSPELPRVPGVTPERSLVIAGSPAGGALLRWFRTQFSTGEAGGAGPSDVDPFDFMLAGVDNVRSSVIVLPHLGGSRFAFEDPAATGAIVGLTYGTTRVDVVRALLDGVAYEIAEMVDRLTAFGSPLTGFVATGGGSRSPAWMQIIADATGFPVSSTASSDGAAYGAARLAARYEAPPVQLSPLPRLHDYAPRTDWAEYHAGRRTNFRSAFRALRNST
jgi:xylulokinase